MTNINAPKSIKEIFSLLVKSPELKNFYIQFIQFKIRMLINSYCRVRWEKDLVKEVFWERGILFVKVSEPSLKKELSFHSEEIVNKLQRSGFKFKEIRFV